MFKCANEKISVSLITELSISFQLLCFPLEQKIQSYQILVNSSTFPLASSDKIYLVQDFSTSFTFLFSSGMSQFLQAHLWSRCWWEAAFTPHPSSFSFMYLIWLSCIYMFVPCQSLSSGPITSWEMEKQWKQCQTLFFGAPKSLQMVTAARKLKDTYSLEGKLWPT